MDRYEGFAEFVPMWVFNNPVFLGADMENARNGTPDWQNGDTVEGRVAGALWDLADTRNEGTDRVGEGIGNIWTTFQGHTSDTLADFWSHRRADGLDVGNNALGSLFQNTIDYGFRP